MQRYETIEIFKLKRPNEKNILLCTCSAKVSSLDLHCTFFDAIVLSHNDVVVFFSHDVEGMDHCSAYRCVLPVFLSG